MYKSLLYLRILLVAVTSVLFVIAAVTNRKYIEGDVILFYFLIPLSLLHLLIFFVSIIIDRRVKNNNFKKIVLFIIAFIQFILSYFIFRAINW